MLLWAAIAAASSRAGAQVLIAAIQHWCAREQNRHVEIIGTRASVVIDGQPVDVHRLVDQLDSEPDALDPPVGEA
ncbi:hypothetical protein [Nocardia halotolerans]